MRPGIGGGASARTDAGEESRTRVARGLDSLVALWDRDVTNSSLFEGEALNRLKLAAEEIAYLTGRGYAPADAKALVVRHRALLPEQEAVLARTVCSEPQYRARASKEMLPEDIARRPLLVDGHDVLDALTTALGGGILLEGLDKTFQPLMAGSTSLCHSPHSGSRRGSRARSPSPGRPVAELRGSTSEA